MKIQVSHNQIDHKNILNIIKIINTVKDNKHQFKQKVYLI